jgi:hypothetical protein
MNTGIFHIYHVVSPPRLLTHTHTPPPPLAAPLLMSRIAPLSEGALPGDT